MRIGFDGWQRSHGMKVMLDKSITKTKATDGWTNLGKGEVALVKVSAGDGTSPGVKVNFHTDVRLGGSQMAEIFFTRKELVHMLKSCSEGLTLDKFVEWFAE